MVRSFVPESPPPHAILTQERVLQRPPGAPKRKRRLPSQEKEESFGHDDGDPIDNRWNNSSSPTTNALTMPGLIQQIQPRRLLFDDCHDDGKGNKEPGIVPASPTTPATFRPIGLDRANEHGQSQIQQQQQQQRNRNTLPPHAHYQPKG